MKFDTVIGDTPAARATSRNVTLTRLRVAGPLLGKGILMFGARPRPDRRKGE
jgi:hypothetical protein